jgi:hypothetical protein
MSLPEVDIYCPIISDCVSSIHQWCASRRLQLNTDKSELIWFASATNLEHLHDYKSSIQFDGVELQPSETVRDLVVILDNKLNMRAHISKTVSTCFFHLRRLRQIRRVLSKPLRQRLVSVFILSRIDYCNVLYAGLPSSSLAPLQRVIHAAARFVANIGPRDHITEVMKQLHWLPIQQRITYKLCTLMHASVNNIAPDYITNILLPVSEVSGRSQLRSASNGLFVVPRTRTSIGSRAFSVAGPAAWNALPQPLRDIKSTDSFKNQLKTFLFKLHYII